MVIFHNGNSQLISYSGTHFEFTYNNLSCAVYINSSIQGIFGWLILLAPALNRLYGKDGDDMRMIGYEMRMVAMGVGISPADARNEIGGTLLWPPGWPLLWPPGWHPASYSREWPGTCGGHGCRDVPVGRPGPNGRDLMAAGTL